MPKNKSTHAYYIQTCLDIYEKCFPDDWIEALNWDSDEEAKESWDKGCRTIADFKKNCFINICLSLFSAEYLYCKGLDDVRKGFESHWRKEHYATPCANPNNMPYKEQLMNLYEDVDNNLHLLIDYYYVLLHSLEDKLSVNLHRCLFNSITYERPRQVDYISILSGLIIPLCLSEHNLSYGLTEIKNLSQCYIALQSSIEKESDEQCKNLLQLALYKCIFILKKVLPKDQEFYYYIDNNKSTVSRETLLKLPDSISVYFNNFETYHEDKKYELDEIHKLNVKCASNQASIKDFVTLIDYYRKNASSIEQLDDLIEKCVSRYEKISTGIPRFEIYAWGTVHNYIINCRFSYLLKRSKQKLSFNTIVTELNKIDEIQQKTMVFNFYPYKKVLGYLLKKTNESLSKKENADYAAMLDLIDRIFSKFKSSVEWCKERNFYPIQLPYRDCRVEIGGTKLFLPSSVSMPINYDKLSDTVDEYKSDIKFLKGSMAMYNSYTEIDGVKAQISSAGKKYIEIGGIFIAIITFLFGTINIFTNEQLNPVQMFCAVMGLGSVLVLFGIVLIIVLNKWPWKDWRTILCWCFIIAYTILLSCIVMGYSPLYNILDSYNK
jgi:hypothetical protein